jgi:hypothetical protein
MKKFLAAFLLVLSTAASAQLKSQVPVNIAAELYTGCIKGFLYRPPAMKNNAEVKEYVTALDDDCMTWTVIWMLYGAEQDMTNWERDKVSRFNALRLGIVGQVTYELRLLNKL